MKKVASAVLGILLFVVGMVAVRACNYAVWKGVKRAGRAITGQPSPDVTWSQRDIEKLGELVTIPSEMKLSPKEVQAMRRCYAAKAIASTPEGPDALTRLSDQRWQELFDEAGRQCSLEHSQRVQSYTDWTPSFTPIFMATCAERKAEPKVCECLVDHAPNYFSGPASFSKAAQEFESAPETPSAKQLQNLLSECSSP